MGDREYKLFPVTVHTSTFANTKKNTSLMCHWLKEAAGGKTAVEHLSVFFPVSHTAMKIPPKNVFLGG